MEYLYLDTVDSTNAFLLRQREAERAGRVVLAREQTAGKGMGSNSWESQPGSNLTFSMGVDLSFLKAADQFLLSQAVPLGLLDCLDTLLPPEKLFVKWPNDLLFDGRKLCGILISSSIHGMEMGVSVIGIGLNVNQTQFLDWPTHPISLRMILEKEVPLEPLLHDLVDAVEARVEALKSPEGIEKTQMDYLRRLFLYHQWGDFETREGHVKLFVEGIDHFGRLITSDEQGITRVYDLKELHLLTSHLSPLTSHL